jgi:hypothetical protein
MDNMLRIRRGEPIVVRVNKLFSYVYVKDLVNIVWDIGVSPHLTKIIGYTDSLFGYARVLKEVTECPHEIIVESADFAHSYVGKSDWKTYDFTPFKTALKEMWDDFNSDSGKK